MNDIKEKLLEKSISFWARALLRLMAWVVMMFYMIYRIITPVIKGDPVYMDKNDGYIMLGCGALLLAIEVVRASYKRFADKKV